MEGDRNKPASAAVGGRTGNISNVSQPENRKDPYVLRAAEKAKNKLRNHIIGLSGGHLN